MGGGVSSQALLGGVGDQKVSPELPAWEYSCWPAALRLRMKHHLSASLSNLIKLHMCSASGRPVKILFAGLAHENKECARRAEQHL